MKKTCKAIVCGVFAVVCFGYGALAPRLNLWPSNTFARAIEAYKADKERHDEINAVMSNPEALKTHRMDYITAIARAKTLNPEKAQPGYTLICVGQDLAMLLDMSGKPLHSWFLPYSTVWKNPPHVSDPNPDEMTRFIDAELFPNGDLLTIYHADNDTPYGYGMVKMDKDSHVIWSVAKNFHHDMYIAHDQRIYSLTHSYMEDYAREIPHYKSPVLADAVTILTPEGKEVDTITIVETLLGTPYEQLLYGPVSENDDSKHDYTHANSVMRLEEDIAAKFPMFKAGQLLVSLRNINTLIVIDPETRKTIWATSGIWREQHDAQFLPNGHIMLFDNKGFATGAEQPRSRLLEIDPATGAVMWSFAGGAAREPFYSSFHGSQQLLPGGNIFTTVTGESNRLLEITPGREVVWKYVLNPKNSRENPINKAYRIDPAWLQPDFAASLK